ncbi:MULTISPECIES: hypothetical protein [unclassified Prochlorococcus]|uniref:hypothetical protein n=1 Tax=unclassified Prochlorococcus TaxID=2627481 RepID=UPI00055EC02A|nr:MULTISPECIES: hypothetical protein [unclassified Prochlorococcus]
METNPIIDSLQLMLTDLRTRNESIRHKAAFKGCQPEFQSLVSKLIQQLEQELNKEKIILRNKSEARTQ